MLPQFEAAVAGVLLVVADAPLVMETVNEALLWRYDVDDVDVDVVSTSDSFVLLLVTVNEEEPVSIGNFFRNGDGSNTVTELVVAIKGPSSRFKHSSSSLMISSAAAL